MTGVKSNPKFPIAEREVKHALLDSINSFPVDCTERIYISMTQPVCSTSHYYWDARYLSFLPLVSFAAYPIFSYQIFLFFFTRTPYLKTLSPNYLY